MRNFAASLLPLIGQAIGQYQLYYGSYFGCRPDYTLCIQVQVLPDSSMKIESFSDSVSLYGPKSGGDRVVHYFPSVRYTWNGAWMNFEERAFGVRSWLRSSSSQLITNPGDIKSSALRNWNYVGNGIGERRLSLAFLNSKQLQMLGVDLNYSYQPLAWLKVVEYCRFYQRWQFVTGNVEILSNLETTFWNIYNLAHPPSGYLRNTCCTR